MNGKSTTAGGTASVQADVFTQWQQEMERNFLRMKNFAGLVMNPKEPEVGPTPYEEIYRKQRAAKKAQIVQIDTRDRSKA